MENQPKPQRVHKHKITITTGKLYSLYKQDLKLSNKLKSSVPIKDFNKIRERLGELILSYIVDDFGEWELPYFFGKLCVVRRGQLAQYYLDIDEKSMYKLTPDWGETKKLWKEKPDKQGQLVYLENEHTLGYAYNLKWIKSTSKIFVNKSFYSFKPSRKLNRRINQVLKNTPFQKINYRVLNNN